MNDITTYYFSYTTAEEQMNYFTGETQTTVGIHNSAKPELNPGVYRVIDGKLCKIKSGLSKKEVKAILESRQ